MAIDASIALGVRPVQAPDQMGALAKVLQLQGAQQGIRLGDLQYQKLTQDIADEKATKTALSEYLRDPNAVSLADLASTSPNAYYKIREFQRNEQKDAAQIAKDQAEAKLKTLETASKRAERAGNILASAKDQASYELAKSALLQNFGPEAVAGLPERFDAQALAPIIQEGMSLKERLEAEARAARLAFDSDKAAVDQRIAQQNADSQRISARASVTSAGAAASQAATARERVQLERDKQGQPEGVPFEVSDRETGKKHLVYRTGSGQLVDANTRRPVAFEAAPKGQDVTPEGAGKVALMKQARQDLEDAKKLLFDDKGRLRRSTAALSNVGGTAGVGEDARKVYSYVYNAIAAKLRMETGAAAPPAEVTDIARRFLPSWAMDSTDSAKDKLDRLQEFMDMGLTELERSGYVPPGAAGSTRPPSRSAIEAELRRRGEKP
jgi:hypothetical protein